MSGPSGCAVGIDLSRVPSLCVIARGGHVELLQPVDDFAALLDQLAMRPEPPSRITLASPPDGLHGAEALLAQLASRFDLPAQNVRVIDTEQARSLGLVHLEHRPETFVDGDAAGAIGAALFTDDDDQRSLIAGIAGGFVGGVAGGGLLSSTAAGEAGGVAGLSGPAGVPLAAAAPGPGGVPLAQTMAGPGGITTGATTGSGPIGVSIASGHGVGPIGNTFKIVLAVAATAIVGLVVVGMVIASGGDDKPTVAAPTVVADAITTVAVTASETTETLDTTSPTVASTAPSVATVADCAVGSWVADNETFGAAFLFFAESGGGEITIQDVSGSVLMTISDDGTVTTTFNNFSLTADVGGAGAAVITENGTETYSITFSDAGIYTVTETSLASIQTGSMGGVTFLDGPSQSGLFHGSAPYSCEGDELRITVAGPVSDWVQIFTRDG